MANRAFHPHILPVWQAGEDQGVFYIATPLADSDLGGLIQEQGVLSPQRALDILGQVAWALDAAHGLGVVHRDIKPENILVMINESGGDHAWVGDFGIAKDTQATALTQMNHSPLSYPYASPEQVRSGQDLDGRSDQYSLACTLYDVFSGEPPFTDTDPKALVGAHLMETPPRLSTRREGIPRALDDVLYRALAKDPGDRYASCGEFLTAAKEAVAVAAPAKDAPEPSSATVLETTPDPGPRETVLETDPDPGKTVLEPDAASNETVLEPESASGSGGPYDKTVLEPGTPARPAERTTVPLVQTLRRYPRHAAVAGAALVLAVVVGVVVLSGGGEEESPAGGSGDTAEAAVPIKRSDAAVFLAKLERAFRRQDLGLMEKIVSPDASHVVARVTPENAIAFYREAFREEPKPRVFNMSMKSYAATSTGARLTGGYSYRLSACPSPRAIRRELTRNRDGVDPQTYCRGFLRAGGFMFVLDRNDSGGVQATRITVQPDLVATHPIALRTNPPAGSEFVVRDVRTGKVVGRGSSVHTEQVESNVLHHWNVRWGAIATADGPRSNVLEWETRFIYRGAPNTNVVTVTRQFFTARDGVERPPGTQFQAGTQRAEYKDDYPPPGL